VIKLKLGEIKTALEEIGKIRHLDTVETNISTEIDNYKKPTPAPLPSDLTGSKLNSIFHVTDMSDSDIKLDK
jgi:hypothetical protein